MTIELMGAIKKVCSFSDIDLKESDIVSSKSSFDSTILHCRNDKEMFEFLIIASINDTYYEVSVLEVDDSPYSCDDCHFILDSDYNLIAN